MSRLLNQSRSTNRITAGNNPFRTSRVESTIRFQPEWLGTSWQEILDRFESYRKTRTVCAVVGPHGTGKTTFFDDLEQRLQQQGYQLLRISLHLTIDGRCELPYIPDEVHPDTIVLLDSAGVIGRHFSNPFSFQQRKMWRVRMQRVAHCQIIESRHRRNRVPVLLQTSSSASMLEAIVRRLDPEWRISSAEIASLYRRHKGNIREALRECYDRRAVG